MATLPCCAGSGRWFKWRVSAVSVVSWWSGEVMNIGEAERLCLMRHKTEMERRLPGKRMKNCNMRTEETEMMQSICIWATASSSARACSMKLCQCHNHVVRTSWGPPKGVQPPVVFLCRCFATRYVSNTKFDS